MIAEFEVIKPLIGGILIGFASAILMLVRGRLAGVSGIFEGILRPKSGDILWRFLFTIGLVLGGFTMYAIMPERFNLETGRSMELIALSGILVGLGVHVGCGCTSGHGVCGISRISMRSIAAVPTFMAFGALTVWYLRSIGVSL